MNKTTLYKYLSIARPEHWSYRRRLLVDREIYFSHAADFNDPLDATLSQGSEVHAALNPCRFFCMSSDGRDDSLMFAHYGDGHRGFRLAFEVTHDAVIGQSSPLAKGRAIRYAATVPKWDSETIRDAYWIKSQSWSYEAEYRIAKVSNQVLHYFDDELVNVAFGYRMSADFESVIRAWIAAGNHKRVTFSRARIDGSGLGFVYVPA